MDQDIEKYLAINPYSDQTRGAYRRVLKLFVEQIDWDGLGPESYLAWLNGHCWGSSARWVAWCATRKYIAWRCGNNHPALALRIKRAVTPPQRSLRIEQVRTLLESFDTGRISGRRNLAMAGVMLDTGLRASEVCRLELRYLYLESCSLQVIVKGGQWRFKVFSQHTCLWLSTWLGNRETIVKPRVAQVFVAVSGKNVGRGMTRDGLRITVNRWGDKIGVVLSPHDLRRSMASVATVLGAPEDLTMKQGGWASHEVFRHYTVGAGAQDFRWFPTDAAMDGS